MQNGHRIPSVMSEPVLALTPMPVPKWAAHLVRATLWLALHLAIATGLFLLSAHLSTQPDEDARNGAYLARFVASLWFYIAAWSWVVRGVFQRPARKPEKGKPTGAQAARGALGCLANLVPVAVVFVFGKRLAEWAWAGISGADTAHPARQLSDQLLYGALYAIDHAGAWVPWVVGALVALQRRQGHSGRPHAARDDRRHDWSSGCPGRQPGDPGEAPLQGQGGGAAGRTGNFPRS